MPDVETSSIQINITAEDNASTTLASITKKLETFATALTQVQASWNSFTENQTAIKTLESVANSINAINGKKIDIKFTGDAIDGKTAENMKKTQEAMEEAAKPASKVAESAEEIRESAQKAADSTQGMTKDWDKLSDSVENASEQASQGYDKIAKSAEKARTQQEKAAESTRNLGNALGISFSHITKTVSLLAVFDAETKVISHQLGLLKGTLSATASGFKALAKASAELIKVTGKISIAIGKAFGRIAVAPIQLMANTIGKVVTKLKDMFAGLVRIATYRLFRSMIKWITQGLSEGIANLYQWSKALDQAFSKAMDLYATDRQYLNNSFAAMLEPLIEQVIPILDQAVDKMVDLLNQFNQFFSAVTGKSTWTKALKVATEYDDVAKDAKKSTDELKRSLLGFDEINRLDDPDKNKKNKKEVDYSAMFKEMPIESDIGNLARKLKELIKADQWFEAGQLLAQKLNELLDMWEPEQAGKIIAKKINNAVDIARGFITTANWKKLGVKFAGTINNLLYNINAKNIGKLIADTLNSAFKFGLGFLETIDGAAIGKNLSDIFNGFFEELDTATIGKTISELLSKAFDIGISYFKNLDKDAFYNSILTLIENIKFGELGDKFADLFNAISGVLDADKISKIFGGLIQGIATFLINAVNNMEIGEMVTNITTTLANLLSDEKTITKVAQAAEALIKGAFTAIGTFISTFPVNDLFNAITTFSIGLIVCFAS